MSYPTTSSEFAEAVEVQRAQIAENALITAMPADVQFGLMGIVPETYAGKKVLDIASGYSDVVATLSKAGALAIGLDVCYVDDEESSRKNDEFQSNYGRRQVFGAILNPEQERRARDAVVEGPRNRFEADRAEDPWKYIPGSALDLPFADKTFDQIFMLSFLTGPAAEHREFTITSMLEALRVLRPHGTITIGPMIGLDGGSQGISHLYGQAQQNIRDAVEMSKQQKIAQKVARYNNPGGSAHLVVTRGKK